MRLSKVIPAFCLAATLATGVTSAFAADGDGPYGWDGEVRKMANKDGMIMKKDFMAMMEKKFDAMDKDKKGMLSMSDAMKIFRENTGQ
ncbi:MAG: hypothetical protein M3Z31_08605 [Pseudomonadota bacterium]|nr:hypothetical protein [Pseudomonadota bacterium]